MKTPEDFFERGQQELSIRNYDEAITFFFKAEQLSVAGKFPKASFKKGNAFYELEEYENAIASYTKAEEDSEEGRYPKASFKKGNALCELGRYGDAIISYTKAEEDSEGGMCPDASFNKGNVYIKLKEYKDAIASYTKAEEDSEDGKYPDASFNKGAAFSDLELYENAITSYTKAENDSEDGGFPIASFNKGNIYIDLEEYKDAIISFTKAEEDSKDGKYPLASFNKGIVYSTLEEYKDSIASYTKAEEDSEDGKYPSASYNKGIAFFEFKGFKDAIISFTKAEDDSVDGKYPQASYSKGIVFFELEQYGEAITSYTKAEIDSNEGKYVEASYNKGIAFSYLEVYENAIISFTKAENDSEDGKYPQASFNKGLCLFELGRINDAIGAYSKANQDSMSGFYLPATIELSLVYFPDDYGLSRTYALKAINKANRAISAFENWAKFCSNTPFEKINENRIEYLKLIQLVALRKEINKNDQFNEIEGCLDWVCDESRILCNLLLSRKFHFTETIQNQYRLAYLIHFNYKRPWFTFYIIDELMDGNTDFELEPIDYYFYCISAYLIGEPQSELRWFWIDKTVQRNRVFKPLNFLISSLKTSYENSNLIDGYLLDININDESLPFFDPMDFTIESKEIGNIIQCISSNSLYDLGIFDTSILPSSFDVISTFLDNSEKGNLQLDFKNFRNSIKKLKDLDHCVEIIREGVKSKDPEGFVVSSLHLLHTKFNGAKKESKKKVYAIIQLIVIASYSKDYKDSLFYSSRAIKYGSEVTQEVGGFSLQEFLVEYIGISIGFLYCLPFKIITSAFLKIKLNSLRVNADKTIESLKIKAEKLLIE